MSYEQPNGIAPVIHAIERAKERYGIDLSLPDLRAMEALVRVNKSGRLHATPVSELHMVAHSVDGRPLTLLAIYSPVEDRIKTFYYPDSAIACKGKRTLARQVIEFATYPASAYQPGKLLNRQKKRKAEKGSAKTRFARQSIKAGSEVEYEY